MHVYCCFVQSAQQQDVRIILIIPVQSEILCRIVNSSIMCAAPRPQKKEHFTCIYFLPHAVVILHSA